MTDAGGQAEHRDSITEEEAGQLPATDPNIAAADHGDDFAGHEAYLGDFVDEDDAAAGSFGALVDAEAAAREDDVDGDGIPDDEDPDQNADAPDDQVGDR